MINTSIIIVILATIAITAVVTYLLTSRRMRLKATYMLDALEDKEINFRFDEKRLRDRKFNKTLNRLRTIFEKERREIIAQEQYYGLMLDHVQTGVVAVDENGRITYCNRTALSLLGLATFSNLRHLKTVSETLYQSFVKVTETHDQRASYYNESGKVTISLTASQAKIGKATVKVVAFNDISSDIAENEQESWSKLIRVLTHEIMNTITPIASLSETLLKFDGSQEDLRSGLESISQSSRGLIKFVDSYRNLTRVASPVKKAIYLRDIVERVKNLTKDQSLLSGATLTYVEKSEDIILYADESQISQILLNLIKNAIQAQATSVSITAEINASEQVIINISNNGSPITPASQKEIFVPFFTTKQNGTGIGLSLSRQIMRLHNGSLNLTRSDEKSTVFTLIFK